MTNFKLVITCSVEQRQERERDVDARRNPMIFTWALAFLLTAGVVLIVGESPLHVFKILFDSAFGSKENFSYTLFYTTPLLLTGTSVSLALKAGLFNIGAEGQLYIGALFSICWGVFCKSWFSNDTSMFFIMLSWVGGFVAAFLGGACWSSIAAYLKTQKGTHEVISTIMLNFIAYALVNWAILNPLKNPETQNPETLWLASSVQIPKAWLQMTPGFPVAMVLCLAVFWFFYSTWGGFKLRATGENPVAAQTNGIHIKKTLFFSFVFSGGLAGLVGFHEVYCNTYRLIDSFSPGYGFSGIAIALLCRGNKLRFVFSSLLLGALHKGALDLDIETEKITRDLSSVIEALIVLALALNKGKK